MPCRAGPLPPKVNRRDTGDASADGTGRAAGARISSRAPGVFPRAVSAKLAANGTLRREPVSPESMAAGTPIRGPWARCNLTPPEAGLATGFKPTGIVPTPPVDPLGGAGVVSDLSDWVNCCRGVMAPGCVAPGSTVPAPVDACPPWPNSTRTAGCGRLELAGLSPRPRLEEMRLLA